jgi:hypothetical protein
MNYLSSSVISAAQAIIDGVHNDTGQTVTAYKHAKQVVIATTPEYNRLYQSGGSTALQVTKTTQSQSFQARILAMDADEDLILVNELDSQVKISLPKGTLRLKLDDTGWDFVKDALRIGVNNNMYNILNDGVEEIHGAWEPRYHIIYLTPIDE